MFHLDWNRTIRKLERALGRDPRSRLFLPLAEAHRELGHHHRAVEVFQMGLTHHPGYIRARIGLARTLKLLGRLDESREELNRVISLAPENGLARRLLAELYQHEGLPEQAALEVRAWLRYQPEAAGMVAKLEGTALRSVRANSRSSTGTRKSRDLPEPVLQASENRQETANNAPDMDSVASLKEGVAVNHPSSKPLLNPGVGIAASRRAEIEAQTILDSATDNPFEDLLGLSGLSTSSRNPTLQAIYREFFPGAFSEPEPKTVEPAPEPVSRGVGLNELLLAAAATAEDEDHFQAEPLFDEASSAYADDEPISVRSFEFEALDERSVLEEGAVTAEAPPATEPEAAVEPVEQAVGAPAIQTLSLVELYLQQGFVDEAREMLERLAEANPSDLRIRQRLDSLRSSAGDADTPHDVLKRWLSAIERVKRHRGFALLS